MVPKKSACIVLNGKIEKEELPFYQHEIKTSQVSIAANGGSKLFQLLDMEMDYLIGDQDSMTEEEVDFWSAKEVKIKKYPVAKDETDLELCLDHCAALEITEVKILAGLGGRIDQQLANIYLLEYARELDIKAKIVSPGLEVGLIINSLKLIDRQGARLSLLSLTEEVSGLKILGCQYNVADFTLKRYKTRGISNIIQEKTAMISVEEGILLYVVEEKNHLD